MMAGASGVHPPLKGLLVGGGLLLLILEAVGLSVLSRWSATNEMERFLLETSSLMNTPAIRHMV